MWPLQHISTQRSRMWLVGTLLDSAAQELRRKEWGLGWCRGCSGEVWGFPDSFVTSRVSPNFFFFNLFRAAPAAYWSSQARELQLLAYITATATQDQSHICNLDHSSRQHQILEQSRNWTQVLMDISHVSYHWATAGTPLLIIFHLCHLVVEGDDEKSMNLIQFRVPASLLNLQVTVPLPPSLFSLTYTHLESLPVSFCSV